MCQPSPGLLEKENPEAVVRRPAVTIIILLLQAKLRSMPQPTQPMHANSADLPAGTQANQSS